MKSVFEFKGRSFSFVSPDGDWIGGLVARTSSFYEREMLEDLLPVLQPGSLVLDVGANIGNHTLFFAGVSGCKVMAIEPNPEAAEFLAENVALNNLCGQVVLKSLAIGGKEGSVRLVQGVPGNLGATRYAESIDGDTAMVTLDSLICEFNESVSLVKIDVEGMEMNVLQGSVELIRSASPTFVVECQEKEDFERVSDFMSKYGYVAIGCYNSTPTFVFLPIGKALSDPAILAFVCRQVVRGQMLARDGYMSLKKAWRHISDLEAR